MHITLNTFLVFISILLLFLFNSCTSTLPENNNFPEGKNIENESYLSEEDKKNVLKEYIKKMMNEDENYDLYHTDFRLLKKYIENDTLYLLETKEKLNLYSEKDRIAFLDGAKEPDFHSLKNLKDYEAVRIHWIICVGDKCVEEIYRLENKNDEVQYVYKTINSDPKCNPLIGSKDFTPDCITIEKNVKKTISLKNWLKIKNYIHDSELRYLSHDLGGACIGGESITIEVLENKKRGKEAEYYRLERSCPRKESPITKLSELVRMLNQE